MGKLLVIYDLMQRSVKIGNETERQSNSIVIRNGGERGRDLTLARSPLYTGNMTYVVSCHHLIISVQPLLLSNAE